MTRAGGRTAMGRFAMYRSIIATADIAEPSGSVRTTVDEAAAPNRQARIVCGERRLKRWAVRQRFQKPLGEGPLLPEHHMPPRP